MKHRSKISTAWHRQQGATLIEVLVSILLMSIGLVAMAAMQVNAVQYSKTNEMRSLATLLANDLADRMRANRSSATSYNTSNTTYRAPTAAPANPTPLCEGLDSTCDTANMATYDLIKWQQALFQQLPLGTGFVRAASNDQVDIWVVWTDPASTNSQDADQCPQNYNASAGVRCMYFRVAL